jgi:hypothetical protein
LRAAIHGRGLIAVAVPVAHEGLVAGVAVVERSDGAANDEILVEVEPGGVMDEGDGVAFGYLNIESF